MSGFALSSNREIDRPAFLVVRSHVVIDNPLGQFPRLANMTDIGLCIRCERKCPVLVIGLTCQPPLQFCHCCGVRPEKGKSIPSAVEWSIIHFSRLRVVDDLPRFVKSLQGKEVNTEHEVRIDMVGHKSKALACPLRRLLIPSLTHVHTTQHDVGAHVHTLKFLEPRIALNHLSQCSLRLVQFPSDISVVPPFNREPFPL